MCSPKSFFFGDMTDSHQAATEPAFTGKTTNGYVPGTKLTMLRERCFLAASVSRWLGLGSSGIINSINGQLIIETFEKHMIFVFDFCCLLCV